jgi:DNA-binding NarL/FixJ family response regulator
MAPIRVLIADDHALLRAGIRALLEENPELDVVAEARDGQEALSLIETHRPEVLVINIAISILSGLEVAQRVSREFPGTRTIILSTHSDGEHVRRALRAGAAALLLKSSGIAELRLAIVAAARGESFLSPAVSKHVIADYLRRTHGDAASHGLLTERQLEVLRYIARGQTTKAIARALGISIKTVETHRAHLMERLDIHDVAGLVRYAIRDGLTTLEE